MRNIVQMDEDDDGTTKYLMTTTFISPRYFWAISSPWAGMRYRATFHLLRRRRIFDVWDQGGEQVGEAQGKACSAGHGLCKWFHLPEGRLAFEAEFVLLYFGGSLRDGMLAYVPPRGVVGMI
jgi:hypothetical protein